MAKLWDFETLGIREDNEVHEELKDMWCPFRGKKELDPCREIIICETSQGTDEEAKRQS